MLGSSSSDEGESIGMGARNMNDEEFMKKVMKGADQMRSRHNSKNKSPKQ